MKEEYIKLKENLQSSLDTQSATCLMLDTEGGIDRKIYNEQDLANVALLLTHIVSNISADYLLGKMTTEQAGHIISETGKNFRKSIKLATGIDLHKTFSEK